MSFSARAAAFVKFWLFSLVIALTLLGPGLAGAEGFRPFNRIVVFGTSLSDSGNALSAREGGHSLQPSEYLTLVPKFLIPDSETPYAVGGDRFSNGPTWVEHFAKAVGLAANAKPAWVTEPTAGASNYAVGGTRARDGVPADPTDPNSPLEVSLSEQVLKFLAASGGAAPRRALYVIEVGSNDLADVLLRGAGASELQSAALSVGQAIGALYCSGASNFLVWNVPNLARTPAVIALNPLVDPALLPHPFTGTSLLVAAEGITRGYNHDLRTAVLDVLRNAPPPCPRPVSHELNIIEFDAFSSLEHVIKFSRWYGLQNVTQPCIRPSINPPFQCPNPERYLFWDGVHPTRAGHGIIALFVAKDLVKAAVHDD